METRIEPVTETTREVFVAYAAVHGAEHDDSYTCAEDLSSFSPADEPACLAFESDEPGGRPGEQGALDAGSRSPVGAASLMMERFETSGLGRFRILHALRADIYEPLIAWVLERRRPGVSHVYCFLPDESTAADVLRGLGFAPTRYAVIMERPPAEVPEIELPPGITIKPSTMADSKAWLRVVNDAFRGQPGRYEMTEERVVELFGDDRVLPGGAFLAWEGDRAVGLVAVWRDDDGGTGEISGLAVVPEARQFGVGRALLRTGMRHAVEAGFDRISLSTGEANDAALALYDSEGFEIVERRVCWGLDL